MSAFCLGLLDDIRRPRVAAKKDISSPKSSESGKSPSAEHTLAKRFLPEMSRKLWKIDEEIG
jgi:hypothetical protein